MLASGRKSFTVKVARRNVLVACLGVHGLPCPWRRLPEVTPFHPNPSHRAPRHGETRWRIDGVAPDDSHELHVALDRFWRVPVQGRRTDIDPSSHSGTCTVKTTRQFWHRRPKSGARDSMVLCPGSKEVSRAVAMRRGSWSDSVAIATNRSPTSERATTSRSGCSTTASSIRTSTGAISTCSPAGRASCSTRARANATGLVHRPRCRRHE